MALPRFQLPLPAARFLHEYWQQQPLLMPGAASGLEATNKAELLALAQRDDVEARIITGAGQGPWALQHGPFSPEHYHSLPAQDWTLLVQSVDYYHTNVSLMLDSFSFLPAWRHEDIMMSYAVTGGSVGPHYDQYDVFLIQAQGQRRWHLGPKYDAQAPRQEVADIDLLADMHIHSSHLMGPGDVLYLPPGVAHWGVAEDDNCITWSVGFRAPRLSDLLARLTDEVLMENASSLFSDKGRTVPTQPGYFTINDADNLTQQALSLINQPAAMRAYCELLTEPRQFPEQTSLQSASILHAHPNTAYVRCGGVRMLMSAEGLWINGECFTLTPALHEFGTFLAEHRLYSAEQLQQYANSEATALLNQWVELGFLAPIQRGYE